MSQETIEARVVALTGSVEALTNEVQDLRKDHRALLAEWQQAKGALAFIKWLAAMAAALGGAIVALQQRWLHH